MAFQPVSGVADYIFHRHVPTFRSGPFLVAIPGNVGREGKKPGWKSNLNHSHGRCAGCNEIFRCIPLSLGMCQKMGYPVRVNHGFAGDISSLCLFALIYGSLEFCSGNSYFLLCTSLICSSSIFIDFCRSEGT